MSFMTRLMPVISWGIKMLLHIGVRMTIFGPMMLLAVRGRKTGKSRTVPVDIHERDLLLHGDCIEAFSIASRIILRVPFVEQSR